MSSKSDSRKHRSHDDYDRHRSHRPRSRSRSPKTSNREKDGKSHRSEKSSGSQRRQEREEDVWRKPERKGGNHRRADREEPIVRKIKSEPADKGYRKYEFPERKEKEKESRSRWDDDDKVENTRQGGDRRGSRQEVPQIRIKQEREHNDERRREHRRQVGDANPFQTTAHNAEENAEENAPPAPKEEPNFGLSGALTEDTNTFRGIVIKYNEPPEARKPKLRWRLYVFKGDQELPTLYIHRQSAYLLGRERLIADLPIDHPSCSKQHAAIQYRLVEYEKNDGTMSKRVRPYIIDLESANGTFLNNKQIEPKRYYEMKEKDVLKFGFSSREYVVLNDKTTEGDIEDEGEI
ncbi:smad nuclear-interacting protein 1-like [Lytechinus pictus]|uniref:smad nuclear-interacting protein 1-like n=1 Tax=Lytechinus pictus TaxID=7653 RepID=UPI00240DB0E9|nr:smad nuclear-interacting protein 1-like [Lytechinus pictus]